MNFIERIKQQLPEISAGELLVTVFRTRFDHDRKLLPPILWLEGWRRHALAIDEIEKELERRWLEVAPPMKLGDTIDWMGIREKLFEFATA